MNEIVILIAGLVVGGMLGYMYAEFRDTAEPRSMAYYSTAIAAGIMTVEEVRKRLGLDSGKEIVPDKD